MQQPGRGRAEPQPEPAQRGGAGFLGCILGCVQPLSISLCPAASLGAPAAGSFVLPACSALLLPPRVTLSSRGAPPTGAEVLGRVGGSAFCFSPPPCPLEWRFKGCKLAGLGCLLVLPAGRIEAQPRRPSRLQRGRCLQQSQSSRPLLPSSLSPLEGGIPLSRREPAHRPGPAQLLWLLPPLCLLGGGRGESQTPPWKAPEVGSEDSQSFRGAAQLVSVFARWRGAGAALAAWLGRG